LAAIASAELASLIGQKGSREAIHRDDLVILASPPAGAGGAPEHPRGGGGRTARHKSRQ
jgi:hypothetical protein